MKIRLNLDQNMRQGNKREKKISQDCLSQDCLSANTFCFVIECNQVEQMSSGTRVKYT